MKTFISVLSLAALVVFAVPASAATISSTNDGALARISYWLNVNFTGTNTNTAEIINEVAATSNSGDNSITSDEYQSGTTITTGAAEAITSVENQANLITVDSTAEVVFGTNGNDRIESTNDSTAIIRLRENIAEDYVNQNLVGVANFSAATANSGMNATDSGEELQNAGITAGTATTGSVVTNIFNKITETFHRHIR